MAQNHQNDGAQLDILNNFEANTRSKQSATMMLTAHKNPAKHEAYHIPFRICGGGLHPAFIQDQRPPGSMLSPQLTQADPNIMDTAALARYDSILFKVVPLLVWALRSSTSWVIYCLA